MAKAINRSVKINMSNDNQAKNENNNDNNNEHQWKSASSEK